MLDRDLAALYGVETGNLNKACGVTSTAFRPTSCFNSPPEEAAGLSFQFGSLKRGQHFKYLPYVFTEQGEL